MSHTSICSKCGEIFFSGHKCEMTLSEKIEHNEDFDFKESDWIEVKDVKEFIKELKEDISEWKTENLELELSVKSAMNYLIDKLAGEELVK